MDVGGAFAQLGAGLSSAAPQLFFWVGWSLLGILIIGSMVGLYFLFQYKWKVTIFERRASGSNSDKMYIGKVRSDRARIIKMRDGTSKWRLLFKRLNIPPVADEHICDRNKVYLFKAADDYYIPLQVAVGNPEAYFAPIEADTRMWAMNELKQAAIEYQPQNFWTENRMLFTAAGVCVLCLIACVVTVYLSYQFSAPNVPAMQGLTNALQTFGSNVGAPVG